MAIEVSERRLNNMIASSDVSEDMTDGYEVDLSKLSEEIKAIRFVNSW